ncbi:MULTISPECIES: molybdopterin-dependent oxidoreductase [Alphaproteobacteria]|jgi:DMSO/TMAO reductase YedYZ molybdopterin-dependent catalytic subunit|uniref:Oxidoreductase molybdopterin binding n=2 Tax=Hyphomicrobiales TaxID=356 RepID=A7IBX0_XANP2|nr:MULTISPECIES: molybdopterin-dependent oxidoreductase [Alphaproteobacteria]ABS65513.1 oxidoreductase molybdopterin binding [Xanthobacter autotrophicus Py2]MAH68310.1 oxidase [Afipia sp.]MBN9601399.1 molybdopterin-dependent oxidoreductase [Afipia felis]OUX62580.1 MAG: oxidase [Afipia sp. TMED4]ABS67913.1 oxidoreductase molybdopterin binding [Xanthobacter autotrophicus Py2]
MLNRRQMLKSAGGTALGIGAGLAVGARLTAFAAETVTLPFANGDRELVAYPGKRPLIRLTTRPPQLETPFSVYNDGLITPNDAFFVRYHLADIPTEIDPESFRVEVKGKVDKPLSLSLMDLKSRFDAVELVAVHQCSGNSRGFFEPRVGGGQAGNGLMGNARWKGVPLKAVLDKAGVQAGAVQVSFGGLDGPVVPDTPDFAKALDIDHARDGEVMLAYEMNGAELPWLNGYPLRLVVPGFYGTYWVKHLNEITVLDKPFQSFWMDTAYRIPANACACTEPGKAPTATVPINRFDVRSFITSVQDGAKLKAGELALRGIAFDGGYGVSDVEVSADGGKSWQAASLGEDLGKYSFREWKMTIPLQKGAHTLMVRAVNRIGQSQPMEPLWNPAGYMRNVVEHTRIVAA